MTNEHYAALLEAAAAETKDGVSTFPGERTISLHAAFAGASLNVSKIVQVRLQAGLVYAQNSRGETTILQLSDIFAGGVEGEARAARKAGFR
jgi:hypothetical protein